jgi:cobalt ECF transporter T component CbiQ
MRKLWLTLAALVILTPLGILAVGSAWGEWSANDFSDPAVRQEIAAASWDHAPPQHTPVGLAHLSSLWKAPLASYAPSFVRSRYFGYFVSAVAGVALTILFAFLVSWLLIRRRVDANDSDVRTAPEYGLRRKDFLEKTLERVVRTTQETKIAEGVTESAGLLQALDPRVNLTGMALLIAGTILVHRLWALAVLFGLSVVSALLSRVPLGLLAKRIWIAVLAFTGVIALPAVFLVPGEIVYRFPLLQWPVTKQGLYSAGFLTLRAETAATLALLLVLCTPWNRLLKALRFFRVPAIAVVMLEMTYRYLFLFMRTAQDMVESRQTRLVGRFAPAEQRRLAGASVGVLLDKSLVLSGDVYSAMQARGFRGEVRILDDFQMTSRDWLQLAAFAGIALITVWLGR